MQNGYALTYSSGLTASHGVGVRTLYPTFHSLTITPQALILYQPKRIAIRGGYFGCHMTIDVFKKSRPDLALIDLDDEYQAGDLVWLETPLNPAGESRYASRCIDLLVWLRHGYRNIKYYADKVLPPSFGLLTVVMIFIC